MKKLYSTSSYKKYNKIHSLNSLKGKMRFKEISKRKKKYEQGKSIEDRKQARKIVKKNYEGYYVVQAPINFSLLENPEGVIDLIERIEDQFIRRNKIYVNLSKVEKLSYDSVVVLLSIMMKFRTYKIDFDGNFPKVNHLRALLINSGFLENLFVYTEKEDRYSLDKKNIYTHGWKNVDAKLTARIIEDTSVKIWGEKRRLKGVQRTFVELMQNTTNHADKFNEGSKHWWLSVNTIEAEKKIAFAFVDYGVGVFESLKNKKPESKFYNVWNLFTSIFKIENNADALRLILRGELHKTATDKHYRGKGLPGIYEALLRNQIINLHIITNDVYANVASQEYKIMNKRFNGTFIYWEIDVNTKNWSINDESN